MASQNRVQRAISFATQPIVRRVEKEVVTRVPSCTSCIRGGSCAHSFSHGRTMSERVSLSATEVPLTHNIPAVLNSLEESAILSLSEASELFPGESFITSSSAMCILVIIIEELQAAVRGDAAAKELLVPYCQSATVSHVASRLLTQAWGIVWAVSEGLFATNAVSGLLWHVLVQELAASSAVLGREDVSEFQFDVQRFQMCTLMLTVLYQTSGEHSSNRVEDTASGRYARFQRARIRGVAREFAPFLCVFFDDPGTTDFDTATESLHRFLSVLSPSHALGDSRIWGPDETAPAVSKGLLTVMLGPVDDLLQLPSAAILLQLAFVPRVEWGVEAGGLLEGLCRSSASCSGASSASQIVAAACALISVLAACDTEARTRNLFSPRGHSLPVSDFLPLPPLIQASPATTVDRTIHAWQGQATQALRGVLSLSLSLGGSAPHPLLRCAANVCAKAVSVAVCTCPLLSELLAAAQVPFSLLHHACERNGRSAAVALATLGGPSFINQRIGELNSQDNETKHRAFEDIVTVSALLSRRGFLMLIGSMITHSLTAPAGGIEALLSAVTTIEEDPCEYAKQAVFGGDARPYHTTLDHFWDAAAPTSHFWWTLVEGACRHIRTLLTCPSAQNVHRWALKCFAASAVFVAAAGLPNTGLRKREQDQIVQLRRRAHLETHTPESIILGDDTDNAASVFCSSFIWSNAFRGILLDALQSEPEECFLAPKLQDVDARPPSETDLPNSRDLTLLYHAGSLILEHADATTHSEGLRAARRLLLGVSIIPASALRSSASWGGLFAQTAAHAPASFNQFVLRDKGVVLAMVSLSKKASESPHAAVRHEAAVFAGLAVLRIHCHPMAEIADKSFLRSDLDKALQSQVDRTLADTLVQLQPLSPLCATALTCIYARERSYYLADTRILTLIQQSLMLRWRPTQPMPELIFAANFHQSMITALCALVFRYQLPFEVVVDGILGFVPTSLADLTLMQRARQNCSLF